MIAMNSSTLLVRDRCPLCASPEVRPVLRSSDHTVSSESYEVWHCNSCTGRFTQAVPDEEHIAAYYQSENYISHSNTRKGLLAQAYQFARHLTRRQKRMRIERMWKQGPGRLLDIGCGTGEFLDEMQHAGWEVMGLEPDAGARQQARELGLDISESEALFSLPPASFDVITLWHVLEHVHRLDASLDAIARALRPGGFILVAVPNYTSADAEHYASFWAAYDTPRHLYHFSPASMRRLWEAKQFEVRRVYPMHLDAFYVSLLSEQYRSGSYRVIPALWQGLRSTWKTLGELERCSSLLYEIRRR
jgi:2-polyprenyl-3-methyl-5-hydroxy-6-metoxy-1,4-benzoquinol methylase